MTARRALFIQGDGSDPQHSAEETRLLMAALLGGQSYDAVAPAIGAIARGHGVIGSGSMAVAPNGTPNDKVYVAAGIAAVRGTQENDQGIYLVGNDGQVELTVSASATNPRNDLVVAQVRDDQYASFTEDDWVLDIVEGTPAASPTDPSVPEDALVLARVRVPTGGSAVISASEIDDLRPRIVATGGITPVAALADLPSPAEGDVVYRTDVDRLAIHTGAAWRHKELNYVASGAHNDSMASSADTGVISFGLTFASAPHVVATPVVGSNADLVLTLQSITTTTASYRVATRNGGSYSGSYTLHWIASGPLAA